ncbi:MAG: 6-carboxytetrahydropterin synthase [Pseudomonadota bacterium]
MQIEFRYRFEAAHRFLSTDSKPCMTPHGHSWHATLGLEFIGQSLNASQMTVEFSEIKKDWKKLIQENLDHSYLHNINDPIVEVLKSGNAEPRLLPFPGDPTTEIIALFLFSKMDRIIQAGPYKDQVQVCSIGIEETTTNKIVCSRTFFADQIAQYENYQGWWHSTDVADRSFKSTKP